jgi:CheY-like chemotaxis protein
VATVRRRVLVVDEDPTVRVTVDRQLDALGWQAICVNNGTEAIRAAEMGLTVDVLLTDVHHVDLDGTAVASAVACQMPGVRVVFTRHALATGPLLVYPDVPVLVKPFSTRRLADALAAAAPIR